MTHKRLSLDELLGDEMIATGIVLPRTPSKPVRPKNTKKPRLTKH